MSYPPYGGGGPGYPARGGYGYPAQGAYGSAMPPQPNAAGYPAPGGPGMPSYPAQPPAPGMPQPGFQAPGGGMPMPDPYGAPPPQQNMGFGAPGYPSPAPVAGGMPHPGYAPAAGQTPNPGYMPSQPANAPYAPSHSPQPPQHYGASHASVPSPQPHARGPSPQPPTSQLSGMKISSSPSASSTSTVAPKKTTKGTVLPTRNFNAEADAKILRKAMKGLGTDEKAIIDVLAHRTNQERQQIGQMFKTMYGKDMVKDLKSELGGHFEDVVVALMMPPDEYDASECRRAMKGAGTDEGALIEILCSRSNKEIHALKQAFKVILGRDLEKDLISETSGHFKRLMVSLANGARMEDCRVDRQKAAKDAQDLYAAGEKRWGTDESRFNQVLASQTFEQLRTVFDEYEKISRKTMEQAISSEMSGDLEDGMMAVVKCVRNLPLFFAEKLYKSMKGLGTDDKTLIRVVVSRCEVDMVQIKEEFQKQYHKSLESFIKGDCSGHYKRVLIALVGGNPWTK